MKLLATLGSLLLIGIVYELMARSRSRKGTAPRGDAPIDPQP